MAARRGPARRMCRRLAAAAAAACLLIGAVDASSLARHERAGGGHAVKGGKHGKNKGGKIKLGSIRFQVVAGADATATNYQDGDAEVDGSAVGGSGTIQIDCGSSFRGTVDVGSEFDLVPQGAFATCVLQADGSQIQRITMHVSCSKPIFVGDRFGALQVVDFSSLHTELTAADCSGDVCDACNSDDLTQAEDVARESKILPSERNEVFPSVGKKTKKGKGKVKLSQITMEYNCANGDAVTNTQSGDATASGIPECSSAQATIQCRDGAGSATVQEGETFELTPTGAFAYCQVTGSGGGDTQYIAIHASCSKPIALRDQFGVLTVVGWVTTTGNTAAECSGDGACQACEAGEPCPPTEAPEQRLPGTASPSSAPTASPSAAPTAVPSASPSAAPTAVPSALPTAAPTPPPTTGEPSEAPSNAPTSVPTGSPTADPLVFMFAHPVDNAQQVCPSGGCADYDMSTVNYYQTNQDSLVAIGLKLEYTIVNAIYTKFPRVCAGDMSTGWPGSLADYDETVLWGCDLASADSVPTAWPICTSGAAGGRNCDCTRSFACEEAVNFAAGCVPANTVAGPSGIVVSEPSDFNVDPYDIGDVTNLPCLYYPTPGSMVTDTFDREGCPAGGCPDPADDGKGAPKIFCWVPDDFDETTDVFDCPDFSPGNGFKYLDANTSPNFFNVPGFAAEIDCTGHDELDFVIGYDLERICFEDPLAVLSSNRGGFSGVPPAVCSDKCQAGFCEGPDGAEGAAELARVTDVRETVAGPVAGHFRDKNNEILRMRAVRQTVTCNSNDTPGP